MLTLLLLAAVGSPVATAADGETVFVADTETDAIWRARPGEKAERLFDCKWPVALALEADDTVWAACREEGALKVLDSAGTVHRIDVGAEPAAFTLDAEHGELFVALATARSLVAVDLKTRSVTRQRALDFEPKAVALTRAGLMVAPRTGCWVLFTSFGLEPAWDLKRPVAALETRYKRLARARGVDDSCQNHVALENADGTALLASSAFETGVRSRGWTSVNNVSLTRPIGRSTDWADPTGLCVRGNELGLAVRSPNALEEWVPRERKGPGLLLLQTSEVSPRDVIRFVSAGSNAFAPLNLEKAATRLDPLAGDDDEPPGPLRAGVSGCSATRKGFAVFEEHARSVAFVTRGHVRRAPLPPSTLDATLRRGRALFFSTGKDISSTGLSCQACHPDGREDGTVWKTDGLLRQTPMLAGRLADTAPYNWHGTEQTLEGNLKRTLQRLQGTGLGAKDRAALAFYLRSGLRPVVTPPPADTSAVERGRLVFHDTGCASCHPPELAFTDGATHDVHSVSLAERRHRAMTASDTSWQDPPPPLGKLRPAFDTPSLRSVGLTAPYLHDGSAPTLEALLATNGDKMGDTRALTVEQRADLAAYLRSL